MGGWPVAVEELNSGLPRTKPDSGMVEDLNQGPPDFKSSALNHSTTLAPWLFERHLKIYRRMALSFLKYFFRSISWNIEAVFFKLGARNVHRERNKMTPVVLLPWRQFCRWSCLNYNWKSQFLSYLSIIHSQQSNKESLDNIRNMSVQSRTSCPT